MHSFNIVYYMHTSLLTNQRHTSEKYFFPWLKMTMMMIACEISKSQENPDRKVETKIVTQFDFCNASKKIERNILTFIFIPSFFLPHILHISSSHSSVQLHYSVRSTFLTTWVAWEHEEEEYLRQDHDRMCVCVQCRRKKDDDETPLFSFLLLQNFLHFSSSFNEWGKE